MDTAYSDVVKLLFFPLIYVSNVHVYCSVCDVTYTMLQSLWTSLKLVTMGLVLLLSKQNQSMLESTVHVN